MSRFYFNICILVVVFGLLVGMLENNFFAPAPLFHYLLAVTCFFLYRIKRPKDLSRNTNSKRSYLFLGLAAVLLLTLYLVINIQVGKNFNYKRDFSVKKLNELSKETNQLLSSLEKPLQIFLFKKDNFSQNNSEKNILELYIQQNKNISYQYVFPENAKSFRDYIEPSKQKLIYLEYGQGEESQVATISRLTEAELSKAINRLSNKQSKNIYYVYGNGEPNVADETETGFSVMSKVFTEQNYIFKGLYLNRSSKLPEDTDLLILSAAQKDYLPVEKAAITAYFELGGKILILADPEQKNNFRFLLDPLAIQLEETVVLEQSVNNSPTPELSWQIFVKNFRQNDFAQDLIAEQLPVVFLLAKGINFKKEASGNYHQILSSSKFSWAESNLKDLFSETAKATFEVDSDRQGPIDLGVAYEEDLTDQSRKALVVYSDLEWLRNANINIYGHKKLLVNTIKFLFKAEDNFTIPSRFITEDARLVFTKDQFRIILLIVLIVPEIVFILLYFVFSRRSNKNV